MARKKRDKKDKPNPGWRDASEEEFHNPFASLAGGARRDDLPPGPQADDPPPEEVAGPAPQIPRRAVVQLERKGRGGKTVTVVRRLGLPPDRLDAWCADLRKSLGVGGAVEGEDLVLQGDQRDRVVDFLRGLGVEKVSVG